MVVLPDGKSLIDGHFTDAGGNPNTDYVARLGVTVPNVDTVDPATDGTQVSSCGLERSTTPGKRPGDSTAMASSNTRLEYGLQHCCMSGE